MASIAFAASPSRAGGDVSVGVQGHRDLAMAQDLHHHPGGHLLSQQQRGAPVPQIVEAHPGDAGCRELSLEGVEGAVGSPRRSGLAGEDEARLVPAWPCCQLCLRLALALRLEGIGDGVGQGEGPRRLLGLGRSQHPLADASLVREPLESGNDAELVMLKVDLLPLEPESFSKPEPEAEDHGDEPFEAVAFEGGDQGLRSWSPSCRRC